MSKLRYFEKEDIIHIQVKDGREVSSVEISPNITAELDANEDIVGVEILNASNYLRDSVLNTVQGKLLQRTD